MWFNDFLFWTSRNANTIIFLVILFLVLRVLLASALVQRAISCKTLWLDNFRVDADTLFEQIQLKIRNKGFTGIKVTFKFIADKYTSGSAHRYMKIRFKGYSCYISAFPLGESDGVISYWVVAPVDRWQNIVKLLPIYGQSIVRLVRIPTLYMSDTQSATKSMIETQIKEVIDDLTKGASTKRETSQEFKTYIQALTNKK